MKYYLMAGFILFGQALFAEIGENDERDESPDEIILTKKGDVERKRSNRAKWLVDHFSGNFAFEVEETIFQFNLMRKEPFKIVEKLFPQEEREIMHNLLKASKTTYFPEIKYLEGRYLFKSGKNILHFNTLDAFQRLFWVGKKSFSYKGMHDIREMVIRFERFLRKNDIKKTTMLNVLMNEANADFFCDKFCLSAIVVGAAVAGGMYAIKPTDKSSEIRKEIRALGRMKKQIRGRVVKCNEDLKKNVPQTMETVSLDNLAPGKFSTFNIIVQLLMNKIESDEKKLGDFVYQKVTTRNPGNCEDFGKFLVDSLSDVDKGDGVKTEASGICKEHRELVSCLTQFAGFFKSYQGGRYFGKKMNTISVP